MKHRVAIPTDEHGTSLAHFGRAARMAVFEVSGGEVVERTDRRNPDPDHLDPAHHRVMMHLVDDCDVVLAAHMGGPMILSLTRLGKEVLSAPSESLQVTLGAYLQALNGGPPLEPLAAPTSAEPHAHHQHG